MAKEKVSSFWQSMKTKDWVMLGVLIVASVICWFWVLNAYSEPLNYEQIITQNLKKS